MRLLAAAKVEVLFTRCLRELKFEIAESAGAQAALPKAWLFLLLLHPQLLLLVLLHTGLGLANGTAWAALWHNISLFIAIS
jgi:hypothetical protein